VRTYGKTLNIGISPGAETPAWVYSDPAHPVAKMNWYFHCKDSSCLPGTVPVTWDNQVPGSVYGFQSAEEALIGAVKKYDSEPNIGYVTISGPGLQNPSMFFEDDSVFTTENSAELEKNGYTEEKYAKAWETVTGLFANTFHTAPFMVALDRVRMNNDAPFAFLSAESGALPNRLLFETQHLGPNFLSEGPLLLQMDQAMRDQAASRQMPFCLQTGSPISNAHQTPIATQRQEMADQLSAAHTFGASWVEVYWNDLADPNFSDLLEESPYSR
jgi:hypothetical protein